jgi:predicted dehydrogenase
VKQLGIAVIGCGYWGGNYVRLFTELPNTYVVVACDQKPENLEKVHKRFPAVQLTTEVSEALAMDGVDAVVVCTNATTHYAITRQCLEAGKHVLLEKPMTTLVGDAEHLMQIAKERDLVLMVGHIYLYNNAIRQVKECIDRREIGQLYYLYARRTNLGPIRYDVNALWDLAPHDISIFNYLLDSTPEWVSAVGHKALRSRREDVGFLVLGYPNNVIGQIHVSWADPDKVREIVAVGSEERIIFNDLSPQEPVRVFKKGIEPAPAEPTTYAEHQFAIRNGEIVSPNIPLSEPLKEQCMHFVDCVTEGKKPLTDGRNGLDVVRVMEAVNQSIERRGAPITLTLEEQNGYHSEAVASLLR